MSVYLLHFDPPYKHARHYVGFSTYVLRRVGHHLNGSGARLVAVARGAGVKVSLARVFRGEGRVFEKALKRRLYGPLEGLCPTCLGDRPRRRLRTLRRATRARWPRRRPPTFLSS